MYIELSIDSAYERKYLSFYFIISPLLCPLSLDPFSPSHSPPSTFMPFIHLLIHSNLDFSHERKHVLGIFIRMIGNVLQFYWLFLLIMSQFHSLQWNKILSHSHTDTHRHMYGIFFPINLSVDRYPDLSPILAKTDGEHLSHI